MTDDPDVRLRRKRDVRMVEHRDGLSVYPEPHVAPVLPAGWAPLETEDELSVLRACDAFPDACRLRLGSIWDHASEYRVYCLEAEGWRGVCAATLFTARSDDAEVGEPVGRNTRLLAIAHTPEDAAKIALDFLNWDLEADGNDWHLQLGLPR